jgi:hypothetical protein
MNASRRTFVFGFIGLATTVFAEAKGSRRGGGRSGGKGSGGGRSGGGSGGCGSKGGPGYRKPNGKCASWKD